MTESLRTAGWRVDVDPNRGAELRFLGRPEGPNLLAHYEWRTPVPASASQGYGSSWLDWMSGYRGGWQELFPNAGGESQLDGVPLPFHGEASSEPWEIVSRDATSIVMNAAARLPLILERTMSLEAERPVLRIEESVHNDGAVPTHFVWAHHPAFEALPGTRIDLPGGAVHGHPDVTTPIADVEPGCDGEWPVVPARGGGTVDLSVAAGGPVQRLCFLPDRPAGWLAIRHEDGRGLAISWDVRTFPHLWLWHQIGAPELPFFGRERVLALEPASYWPADGLAAAVERGQAHRLEPGQRHETWLTAVAFEATDRPVVGMSRDGKVEYGGEG